jgi:hypothetical protein
MPLQFLSRHGFVRVQALEIHLTEVGTGGFILQLCVPAL